MRLVAVVVVCALVVGQDGGVVAAGPRADSAWRTRAAGRLFSRRSGDLLQAEDANPCLSLRESDDQRQLLCNDRRSRFNFNPFGLRFGKRYNGDVSRGAERRRGRTRAVTPRTRFLRDLEVPAWKLVPV